MRPEGKKKENISIFPLFIKILQIQGTWLQTARLDCKNKDNKMNRINTKNDLWKYLFGFSWVITCLLYTSDAADE